MGPAVKRDGRPPLFGRQWVGHLRCQAEGGKVCAQYQSGKRTCYALLSSACHCVPRSCKRTHASVFSMSLRTSAHTGVAIRVPAEKPGKSVVLRANSSCFSYLPKVFLFVLWYCKEYGLPRRSAPRNDMLKLAACPRLQGRNDMLKLAACPRLQGRNDMLKLAACPRLQGRNDMLKLVACPRLQGRNDMQKTEARQRLQGGLAQ